MEKVLPPDYHLILIDIAVVAAAQASGVDLAWKQPAEQYTPGCIRNHWLSGSADLSLQKRVTALATASSASLSQMSGPQLTSLAERYQVPLAAELAETIASYFKNKREAVLTYNR